MMNFELAIPYLGAIAFWIVRPSGESRGNLNTV